MDGTGNMAQGGLVTEPMTDARLAEIRVCAEAADGTVTGKFLSELLAEVDRMRALTAPPMIFGTPPADVLTPEQVAEWQAKWDQLGGPRVEWSLEQPAPGIIGYDFTPPPPRSGPDGYWTPLRNPFRDQPRSNDYPAGG